MKQVKAPESQNSRVLVGDKTDDREFHRPDKRTVTNNHKFNTLHSHG